MRRAAEVAAEAAAEVAEVEAEAAEAPTLDCSQRVDEPVAEVVVRDVGDAAARVPLLSA